VNYALMLSGETPGMIASMLFIVIIILTFVAFCVSSSNYARRLRDSDTCGWDQYSDEHQLVGPLPSHAELRRGPVGVSYLADEYLAADTHAPLTPPTYPTYPTYPSDYAERYAHASGFTRDDTEVTGVAATTQSGWLTAERVSEPVWRPSWSTAANWPAPLALPAAPSVPTQVRPRVGRHSVLVATGTEAQRRAWAVRALREGTQELDVLDRQLLPALV
jgi:hypothetical protein